MLHKNLANSILFVLLFAAIPGALGEPDDDLRSLRGREPPGKPSIPFCFKRGNGTFMFQLVNSNRVSTMLLDRGGGFPGDNYPGQPGFVFGDDCELVPGATTTAVPPTTTTEGTTTTTTTEATTTAGPTQPEQIGGSFDCLCFSTCVRDDVVGEICRTATIGACFNIDNGASYSCCEF